MFMPDALNLLSNLIGQDVVVDMRSTFVCLGTLKTVDDRWFILTDADLHDLRDTPTNRENYVAESKMTGIKRNRTEVYLNTAEVVAVTRFDDLIDE